MANFFARQPVPLTPNPEPAGYDVLRYMLMQRAMGQMMNPYGLSPQGMSSFGGFNQGSRPFNPYGQGFGPGGPVPSAGGPTGGGMGAGILPPIVGGAMNPDPDMFQFLKQLFAGQMGGAQGGGNVSPISAPRPAMVGPRQGYSSPPQQMRTGVVPPPVQQTRPNAPRALNPIDQQMGGYDGRTVGYGGIPTGGMGFHGGPAQGHFPIRQPANVMSMMRALGQIPRPHMMNPMPMAPQQAHPMGAMRMPMGRRYR